mgnify:CR=1 FL=1
MLVVELRPLWGLGLYNQMNVMPFLISLMNNELFISDQNWPLNSVIYLIVCNFCKFFCCHDCLEYLLHIKAKAVYETNSIIYTYEL